MRKKISRSELIELRKKEQARREFENALKRDVEMENRAQEKYLGSNRVINFLMGAGIGIGVLFFIERFILGDFTEVIPLSPYNLLLIRVLKILFVVMMGMANMLTGGRYGERVKDFFMGFWKR